MESNKEIPTDTDGDNDIIDIDETDVYRSDPEDYGKDNKWVFVVDVGTMIL